MNGKDPKLTACFKAVFPRLNDEEIAAASAESLPEWDSVATVTLLCLISEEFGIEVEWDRVEEMNSFAAIAHMIRATPPAN